MARTGKLSAVEVAKAKGPAVLHDGGGLYLRVSAAGARSWVFRFQLDGKRRDMGLGPFPDISLAEARAKAIAHRKQRHDGIDPLDAKAAQRQAQRLSDVKGRIFREVPRNSSAATRPAGGTPSIGNSGGIPLRLTSTRFWGNCPLRRSMPGLWCKCSIRSGPRSRKRQAECAAASRRCSTPRRCAASGRDRTQRNGKATSRISCPARAKVRKVAHHAALPFDDMPEFLAALRSREGMSARALEFAVLTAARTGEVLGARWGEIDLDERALDGARRVG